MNFKPAPEEPYYTTAPADDLLSGNFANISDMLKEADALEVAAAIITLNQFMCEAEANGHLEIG